MSGTSEQNLVTLTGELEGVTYDGTNLLAVTVSESNGVYTINSTNNTHDGDGAEPFTAPTTTATGPDPSTEVQVDPQAYGGTTPFYYEVIGYSAKGILLENLTAAQQPYPTPRYTVISGSSATSGPTVVVGDTFGTTGTPMDPPCFVTGSRILTTRGEIAVENLAIDDVAICASGAERRIVWIGSRTVAPGTGPRSAELQPVRVAAGAFADAMPNADLWLSPGHSVFVDGALIPVSFLVNDLTITQHAVPSVTYWHVELETHDILISQNLPSESYLDTGNRSSFSNGAATIALFPNFAPVADDRSCAPLVTAGPVLAAVRERVLGRLAAFGYAEAEHEGLTILADGVPVSPLVQGGTLRVSVPGNTRTLTLASSSGIPAHHDAAAADRRRLGVAITGLRVGSLRATTAIALDDAQLTAGFHALEGNADHAWRWTDGNATIALAPGRSRARRLIVEIDVMPTPLWVDYVTTADTLRRAG